MVNCPPISSPSRQSFNPNQLHNRPPSQLQHFTSPPFSCASVFLLTLLSSHLITTHPPFALPLPSSSQTSRTSRIATPSTPSRKVESPFCCPYPCTNGPAIVITVRVRARARFLPCLLSHGTFNLFPTASNQLCQRRQGKQIRLDG